MYDLSLVVKNKYEKSIDLLHSHAVENMISTDNRALHVLPRIYSNKNIFICHRTGAMYYVHLVQFYVYVRVCLR